MPVDLRVKDFQIVEDAEIEIDGLVVVVGQTDQGKSSLIRAVDYAVSNESGDDFVREDQDAAEVELSPESLPALRWKKPRGSGATYWLGEEKYDAVGRGRPDFLDEFKMAPIEAGPDSFDVNFWRQMDSFLLIGRPNTRKFELLSKLFEGDAFSQILDDLKSDRKDLKSDLEVKSSLLEEKEEELQEKSLELEVLRQKETLLEESLDGIEERRDRLKKTVSLNQKLEETREVLRDLPSIENIEQLKDDFLSSLETCESLRTSLESKRQLLEKFNETSAKLEQIDGRIQSLSSAVATFESLDEEKLERYKKVRDYLEELKSSRSNLQALKVRAETSKDFLSEFGKAKELYEKLQNLFEVLKKFKEEKTELKSLREKTNSAKDDLKDVQSELERVRSDLDVCPTCGQSMKGDHDSHV